MFRDGSWVPAREHRTASVRSLAAGSASAGDSSVPATPHTPRGPPPLRLYSSRLASLTLPSLTLPSGRQLSLELPGAFSGRLPPTPARAPSGIRQVSFNLSSSPERTSMESASEATGSHSPRLHRVTESPFEQD